MKTFLTQCLVLAAVVATSAGWAWSDDQDTKPAPPKKARATVVLRGQDAGSGYWIGVMGTPVDDLLKSHLKLASGLVVQHVVPDSPAGKAGVREHDILLRFNQTTIGEVSDLAAAIAENKDKEGTLKLLRSGDEVALKVTPAKRPASAFDAPLPPLTDLNELQDWLKKMEKGELGDDPLRMLFVQPGIVMPKDWPKTSTLPNSTVLLQLPNDTTITVKRDGAGPATAVVKRGDETWEVTEDSIDQLPEDLRTLVRGIILGTNFSLRIGDNLGLRLREQIRERITNPPGADKAESESPAPKPAEMDALLKQMEQVKRQLQDSSKQLERLQERVQKLE